MSLLHRKHGTGKLKRETVRALLLVLLCCFFVGCGREKEEPLSFSEEAKEPDLIVTETTEIQTTTEPAVPDATPGEEKERDLHEFDINLVFAGDISFSESSLVMAKYRETGEQIDQVISGDLIRKMQEADVCFVNNEFTYSDRGAPLEGKAYTFRAKPERVAILQELGVDIAGLANNHVYDYGEEALLDTLQTIDDSGIRRVGAGHNLKEAMTPVYMTVDDKIVSFVAASRAEKFKMTPQATDEKAGILRCYDTELFVQEIAEAKANSDFCIAIVHWGTEYSTDLEEVQPATAREYLDAGADAVIGGHSHCLQGFEFYNGKPIAYSLGNFWFNEKELDTMLVTLHIFGDDNGYETEMILTPALQSGCVTREVCGENAESLFGRLEEISIGVSITEDGIVTKME